MDKLEEVFTAWHEQAEQLLPEFNFIRKGNGNLIARSGYKITGESGKPNKVHYYANRPNTLFDFTRGTIGILQYIQERQQLNTKEEALRFMAEAAGVKLDTFRTEEDRLRWQQQQRKYDIREAALQFFVNQLHTNTEPKAEEVRQYLKRRGYKRTDLQQPAIKEEEAAGMEAAGMELGYYAAQDQLRKYLTEAGFTDDEVTDIISRSTPEGVIKGTHPVVIAYRNAAGNLLGFIYRSILPSVEPKYLLDKGIKRGAQLFNFISKRRTQDLVITEGILDALIATARGVPNVTALVAAQITEEQARQAVLNCGGSITLCLDADKAGREGTAGAIDKLLQTAKAEGVWIKVYVAQLPEGFKDADELITKQGAEAFSKVIQEAEREIHYLQTQIYEEYKDRDLTVKEQDQLLQKIEQNAAKLLTPTDRSRYTSYFEQFFKEVVTAEALTQTAELLAYDADRQRQQDTLKKQLNAAQKALEEGTEPEDVLKKLQIEAERIKVVRGVNLLQTYGYEELIKDVLNRKEGLKTGFRYLDKVISIKRGALSLIAGRTSHGKTTLMFNMALRMIRENEGLRFYFLSYEETKDRLLMKITASLTGRPIDQMLPEYHETPDHADKLEAYLRELHRGNRKPVAEIEAAFNHVKELLESGRLTVTDKKYYIEELEALIKTENRKHGKVGAFFIDYATKIKSIKMQDERADIRREVIHVTEALEQVAKDTDTALIVGAQLNRTAAAKGNTAKQQEERPRLEHLKESGSLEEGANIVLAIYNAEAERTDSDKKGSASDLVTLEVHVLKNRDGKRNKFITLQFEQEKRLISDSTAEQHRQYLEELNKKKHKAEDTYEEKKEAKKKEA